MTLRGPYPGPGSREDADSRRRSRSGRPSARGALTLLGALLLGGFLGWLIFADHGGTRRANRPTGAGGQQAATYPTLGLTILRPPAWHASRQAGVIKLLSPDQTASIAISAPAAAGLDAQLRRADERELSHLFQPSQVIGHRRGSLGGKPVLTTELVGQTSTHHSIRILSTAVSSPYRTYSVQVFSALKPPARRLAEVRNTLASLRFSVPKG